MQSRTTYKYIYRAFLIFLAVSFIFSISLENVNFLPIYLLPLLCFICFLLFQNIRKHFNSLAVMTISMVCLIRYGLYPLTICIQKATSSSYVIFQPEALNLMVYEMLVVFFFLNFYVSRLDSVVGISSNRIADYNLSRLNKFFLLLTVPLALVFPSLLRIFTFLGVGGSAAPVSGIFATLFKVGLYVGYLLLLSKCSKGGSGNFVNLLTSILIAIVYIFVIAIGESSVSRWAFLWIGIPTLIILTNIYPHYKRSIITFSCIALPFGIIAGSFVKFALTDFSVTSFFSNFITSDSLSEYFGGLNGLSFVVSNVSHDVKAATMYSTFTDLLCSAPLLSAFFDFENYSTQSIYLDYLNRTDLICPLLGQSFLHFGFWGAPLFSIMMVILSIEFERVSKKADNVYLKYAGLSLCITFSLFMCLNTIIILSNAWVLIMFLIIQLYNSRK